MYRSKPRRLHTSRAAALHHTERRLHCLSVTTAVGSNGKAYRPRIGARNPAPSQIYGRCHLPTGPAAQRWSQGLQDLPTTFALIPPPPIAEAGKRRLSWPPPFSLPWSSRPWPSGRYPRRGRHSASLVRGIPNGQMSRLGSADTNFARVSAFGSRSASSSGSRPCWSWSSRRWPSYWPPRRVSNLHGAGHPSGVMARHTVTDTNSALVSASGSRHPASQRTCSSWSFRRWPSGRPPRSGTSASMVPNSPNGHTARLDTAEINFCRISTSGSRYPGAICSLAIDSGFCKTRRQQHGPRYR